MGTIFSDEDLAVAAHDVRDFGAKGDGDGVGAPDPDDSRRKAD